MLYQTAVRNHGRKIKACLKADCLQCVATTALNVEGCLAAGKYIEAWCHLKGWYCLAEERLNHALRHRGGIWLNVDPSDVPDAAPTDLGLRAIVGQLRNGCVAATGMKAKHLKEWLANMKHEKKEDWVKEIGDQWQSFVALLQVVWEHGSIPTQMTWMIIVHLPKGGG